MSGRRRLVVALCAGALGSAGVALAQAPARPGAPPVKAPAGKAAPAKPSPPAKGDPGADLLREETPPPSAEAFLGPWKATMTADYTTCAETKHGDTRVVVWTIDARGGTVTASEKGGAKGDPKSYTGGFAADGTTLELRSGKTAGVDLRADGAVLRGRHVAVRKAGCVVIYDVRAERPNDQPTDVGDKDPDAGTWSLAAALAGMPHGNGPLVAEISTDAGTLTCQLFADKAPATVASFVGLARGLRAWKDPATGRFVRYRAFYDGLAFHRVIPEFIIQGGDPLSRDWGHPALGTGGPGYTLPDEAKNGLRFDGPGKLAMANKAPGTNSGGSQFFITEKAAPQLDGSYTIFGQCGPVDVIKAAARVPASAQGHRPDVPLLMKVTIRR